MRIPCKNGDWFEVSGEVQEAYAALHHNAEQEFARMVIWLAGHEGKRPASQKSAARFVANWFKRVPRKISARPKVETAMDKRVAFIRQLTGMDQQREVVDVAARRVG